MRDTQAAHTENIELQSHNEPKLNTPTKFTKQHNELSQNNLTLQNTPKTELNKLSASWQTLPKNNRYIF